MGFNLLCDNCIAHNNYFKLVSHLLDIVTLLQIINDSPIENV